MSRVQSPLDHFPSFDGTGQESESHLFPTGASDIGHRSNLASAALNSTIHLLQSYSTPAFDEAGQISPPISEQPSTTLAMSTTQSSVLKRRKLCFVTVGATAAFDKLTSAAQNPRFLAALEQAGFTNLLIQHGHAGEELPTTDIGRIRVSSFDFRKDGIQREVAGAKGDTRRLKAEVKDANSKLAGLDLGEEWQSATWEEGVVISHAGSGSILDALRVSAPIIVVPNETLLDNHQIDLARELAKQGYVVHGHVDRLADALMIVESKRANRKVWPPPTDPNSKASRGLIGIMDEEMGYTDLKTQTKGSKLYLD